MKIAALALAAATAAASAGDPFTLSFDDTFNGFGSTLPIGSGIQNENFAIARNDTAGVEIGLQAIERFVGTIPNTDERYFVNPGFSPVSGSDPTPSTNSTWNYNWGIVLPTATQNWDIELRVDFDSGFGMQDFVAVDLNAFLDPLNINTAADSQNLAFGFWQLPPFNAPAFDPNAFGEYDIDLTVRDLSGSIVARSAIVIEVVPGPGSAALLGLGGLVAMRRRR